jgi:hypothetical protein
VTASDQRDDRDDERSDCDDHSQVGEARVRGAPYDPRLEDEEPDEDGRDDSRDETGGEGHGSILTSERLTSERSTTAYAGPIVHAPFAVTAMKMGPPGSNTVPWYAPLERANSFGPSAP